MTFADTLVAIVGALLGGSTLSAIGTYLLTRKRAEAEARRENAQAQDVIISSLRSHVEWQKEIIAEFRQKTAELECRLAKLEEERNRLRNRVAYLAGRVRYLEGALGHAPPREDTDDALARLDSAVEITGSA